ncbi:MAG: cytochrome C, partial [Verrucomicrobia bacterium]
ALYLCDMYREVIEHPWSLPDSLKKHLDLNSGNDRGRIYRLVPERFQQPKQPRLSQATINELVKTLEHPNGWHRDTAARLLYERQDPSAVPPLKRSLGRSKWPLGRLHALGALDGLGALAEPTVRQGLEDPSPLVRAQAVKLSERFLANSSTALWAKLSGPTMRLDPMVRYQLAFSLGETRRAERLQLLVDILRMTTSSTDSSWIQVAALSSLSEGAGELFAKLVASRPTDPHPRDEEFLLELARLIGARNKPAEIAQVLHYAPRSTTDDSNATSDNSFLDLALARALGEGLRLAGTSLAQAGRPEDLKSIFGGARWLVQSSASASTNRLQAIAVLGQFSYPEAGALLIPLLDSRQPQAVQLAALHSCERFTSPELGAQLTKRWSALTPALRAEALNLLLKRPEQTAALLTAMNQGLVRPSELSASQINFLRTHRDPKLREQAGLALGAPPNSSRQEVVQAFLPALTLAGEGSRGRKLYLERCSSCHRLGNEGHALGPDLATVKAGGREKLLVNILDPNREVNSNYISYLVETKDGETLTGILGSESATSLALRQAGGVETPVLRSNIASLQSLGQSLMPEGLEAGLNPQDLADLLEFILKF